MSVVKVAAPSVSVLNKNSLVISVDTGAHEKKLADLGLSPEFQMETKQRELVISNETGLPLAGAVKGVPYRRIQLTGAILSYSLIEAKGDKPFRLAIVSTQVSTVYVVMIDKVVFSFIYDVSAVGAREGILLMLEESINRGVTVFGNNGKLVPDFWKKSLSMLAGDEQYETFNLTLRDFKGNEVPAKILFSQKDKDQTISVGGLCYNFPLDELNRPQIQQGLNIYRKEQEIRGNVKHSVQIGQLLIKKGNKDKERVKHSTPTDLKPVGGFGRLLTDAQLKAAVEAPEKPEKVKPVPVKPVAKEKQKKTKAKA